MTERQEKMLNSLKYRRVRDDLIEGWRFVPVKIFHEIHKKLSSYYYSEKELDFFQKEIDEINKALLDKPKTRAKK